jgi:gentisate 1,2-dioxygenase
MSQPACPSGRKRVGVLGAACALLVLAGAATLSARLGGPDQEKKPDDANLPLGNVENYRPRNLTLEQVRRIGAIGNLNEGIEIQVQGVAARLLAWPGIGFQNQSLHVLTLRPGDASRTYTYDTSEESLICLHGKGEVFLRGRWVDVEAGDIAYFPEGTAHAVRNPKDNKQDFVLVSQITPPELDLYAATAYYSKQHGEFNYAAIAADQKKARPGNLPRDLDVHYNASLPELRAWNLTNADIRRQGALFNMFTGAEFTGIGVPMRILLFPGFGTRSGGVHCGYLPPGAPSDIHTHPLSEDVIMTLMGQGWMYIDGKRVNTDVLDVAMATVLARHGGGSRGDKGGFVLGFCGPPEIDLYMRTAYFKDGQYVRPQFKKLELKKGG